MKNVISSAIIGLLVSLSSVSHAALITFSDRATFQAAAGALTLETFSDKTFEAGLSLSTGSGFDSLVLSPNCPTSGNVCQGLNENASATFSFSPGVKAFGFSYNELNVSSLDYIDSAGHTISSALTANIFTAPAWTPKFFGVISDVDLDWFTIGTGVTRGAVYFIDDLEFSTTASTPTTPTDVPAPAPLALLALGLLGLSMTRRKA